MSAHQLTLEEVIEHKLIELKRKRSADSDLTRVRGTIGKTIVAFCILHFERTFHVSELREFVEARVGAIAPDSPGRILRDLRRDGVIDYEVVSRSESLYRIKAVAS